MIPGMKALDNDKGMIRVADNLSRLGIRSFFSREYLDNLKVSARPRVSMSLVDIYVSDGD
jgi:hypothetical protein